MGPQLLQCENCGKPAVYVWNCEDGSESPTCASCRPIGATTLRNVGDEDQPPPVKAPPLTIAQAAQRESVSVRTLYRWVESGELGAGAWKAGSEWRIDPEALDARRLQGPRPRPRDHSAPAPTIKGRSAPDSDWPT